MNYKGKLLSSWRPKFKIDLFCILIQFIFKKRFSNFNADDLPKWLTPRRRIKWLVH